VKRSLSPKHVKLLAGGGALLLVLAATWFLVVNPQRAKVAKIDTQIASTQQEIDTRTAVRSMPASAVVRETDLYLLTKAVPDATDMPGIMLDLDRLARESKVAFVSISPGPPLQATGYTAQPVTVVVEGSFFDVTKFVHRLRTLVSVQRGHLVVSGRLFAIDEVQIAEGTKLFPQVKATLTIAAFVNGGAPPVPAATDTTDTTGTTTTTTTTPAPTPAPSGATAAGATP
jgi:Tfp pilus assembly protein PilO